MADVTSRTGGQLNMSIFGKNLTNNQVDVYQLLITTGDPITFPLDNLSSGNYDYQGVRDRSGKIIGQVQLDEQDPAGEISFSLYEDFDYVNDKYISGNSKNRMLNLFNGEAFKDGEDIIVPIGTNGTDKTKTALAKITEMNKPYKYLLYNEGFFIKETGTADPVTGEVSLKKNPYESSFNRSHKTFCLEFMTTTGLAQTNRMLAVIAKSTLELAEGDMNQINFTGQKGCDTFERDSFWTEVYKSEPIQNSEKIKELYVKYIVKHDATEPTEGAEGDLIAVVGVDGTVDIKKYSVSSYSTDSTTKDKIKVGTRIKSNILRETGSTDINVNCFIAIDNEGRAVDFSTNNSKRFYCKVYDFDRTAGKFVEYSTAE